MTEPSLARQIADDLLEIGAVTFSPGNPFTWASGLRSPVYCDNRLTISFPAIRRRIRDGFRDVLRRTELHVDAVVGTATAGIPHAAWLADALDLPLAYVRSKPKAHGRESQVEGRLVSGSRTVVVEDLVSTGGSSATVVNALGAAGVQVEAVLAIFSYGLDAAARSFENLGVPLYPLTGFEALFAAARARDLLSEKEIHSIRDWRADPEAWSQLHSEA